MDNILSLKFFLRQINYLVISLVKTLFSRNFCQKSVRLKFHNFHTVHSVSKLSIISHYARIYGNTLWKNEKFTLNKNFFRQINSLVIYLVNALLSRKFCQKWVRVNFCYFHTVLCTIVHHYEK